MYQDPCLGIHSAQGQLHEEPLELYGLFCGYLWVSCKNILKHKSSWLWRSWWWCKSNLIDISRVLHLASNMLTLILSSNSRAVIVRLPAMTFTLPCFNHRMLLCRAGYINAKYIYYIFIPLIINVWLQHIWLLLWIANIEPGAVILMLSCLFWIAATDYDFISSVFSLADHSPYYYCYLY